MIIIRENNFNIKILSKIIDQEFCPLCYKEVDNIRMAAVPQGAFAAKKIRENEEKRKVFYYNTDLTTTNYSSKYMNSIWGEYNRYSVHNLKKIMDENVWTLNLGQTNAKQAKTQIGEKSVFGSFGGSSIAFKANTMS